MSASLPQAIDIRPMVIRHTSVLSAAGYYTIFHKATPSTDPRTPANDLFFVNRRDMMLRHNGRTIGAETIAFSKRDRASWNGLIHPDAGEPLGNTEFSEPRPKLRRR